MELQIILNSFASDVFRRQADFDYISARANYRMRLRQQFLWSAQQSVEKYLKAILLFNGKSARYYYLSNKKKEFIHDLDVLNAEVKGISDLNYEIPEWAPKFISYLNDFGNNRYISKESYNRPEALHQLDELVWNIRRYCQSLPTEPRYRTAHINLLNSSTYKLNPFSFFINGGELEKIIKLDSSDPAKKALIWANLRFGVRVKKVVQYRPMSSSEIPPNERDWYTEAHAKIIEEYIKPPWVKRN